jgi:thioredoxin domain-containing protein 5
MHILKTSLFSSLVLLVASAIPVSGTALTPDTFDSTIQNGLWFIEHFSPYCSHCKHFKPTWEQLVAETQTEIPEVKTATVDCIMYGDLCDKNNINSYPTLLMFEDGKQVDQFRGARDLPALKTFMKRHIKVAPESEPEPKPKADAEPAPEAPPAKIAPPTQAPKPRVNTDGQVISLDADTFTKTLAKGPAFVKFFAPWCGHCKKLAPTWKQLARHMQDKVTIAEVNCDDHSALCKAQGIQGYPTLVWYAAGDAPSGKSEYNGGRKLDALKAFAEKAAAAGVQDLEKTEDLDAFVAKEDVVYLLLHTPENAHAVDIVREAAIPLLGSPQILASSDAGLLKSFSVASPWALVAIKDHDMKLPAAVHYGSDTSTAADAKLRKWLLTHRLPTSLELARDTFQNVMNAPQKPLVVIAAAPGALRAQVLDRLNDVAKVWRVKTDGSGVVHGREVVFAYMDHDEWAEWLSSMYRIKKPDSEDAKHLDDLDKVPVVIADHSNLVYYDGDRDGNPILLSKSANLFAAVGDAATGKSEYKNSESFIERIARNINAKMIALEGFVVENIFLTVVLFGFGLFVIFYVMGRLLGNDTQSMAQSEWARQKGRLD